MKNSITVTISHEAKQWVEIKKWLFETHHLTYSLGGILIEESYLATNEFMAYEMFVPTAIIQFYFHKDFDPTLFLLRWAQ